MTEAEINKQARRNCARLQKMLRLGDWRVEVHTAPLDADFGQCVLMPEYRSARITISSVLHRTPDQLLATCVHEMLHLSLGALEGFEAVLTVALKDEDALRRTLQVALVQAVEASVTALEGPLAALYKEQWSD